METFNGEDKEEILSDTEFTLFCLSEELPSDAKGLLRKLQHNLLKEEMVDASGRDELVAHVEAALAALYANYNYRQAAWHLWKVHRAVTGRTWGSLEDKDVPAWVKEIPPGSKLISVASPPLKSEESEG